MSFFPIGVPEGTVHMDPTTVNSSRPNLGQDVTGTTFYTLVILLFAICTYVFIVLCVYVHKFFRKRRSRMSTTSPGSPNGFGKIAISMRLVAVFIALMCLLHFSSEQALVFTECCRTPLRLLSLLSATIAMMLSYLFFWFRQRVLYDAPSMRLFTNKFLRFLSWLSLALVVLNGIVQVVLSIFLSDVPNPTWIYLSWLSGCLLVQGSLMTLFLFPLLKHLADRKSVFGTKGKVVQTGRVRHHRALNQHEAREVGFGIRDSNIFTVTSTRTSSGSTSSVKRRTLVDTNPMYRAVRRCVVCASIAFISDIIVGVFIILDHYYFKLPSRQFLGVFLFDLNLVVDSIFVVGCFSNWRYILLPKCYSASYSPEFYASSHYPEFVVHKRSVYS